MNIVTATFSAGCTQIDADRKLWQYDQGQILQFVGLDLPDAYQVEFSNTRDKGSAKAQIGGPDGVQIPDEYLITGKPVYAFLVGHTAEEDRETEKLVVIYVNARSQPTDEPIAPEQQGVVDQLIAALTAGVEKAEDAAAQAEEAIGYMPKIVDGTWWVYDAEAETWADTGIQAEGFCIVDYVPSVDDLPTSAPPGAGYGVGTEPPFSIYFYTESDGWVNNGTLQGPAGVSPTVAVTDITGGHRVTITDAAGSSGFDVMDGTDGSPGTPGVSPTVTVTDITGGHRVTITDAAGSSSFDVMDGTDGSPGTPGVSPTVTVTDITGGHRVTITDATGAHSFDVMDGTGGSDVLLVTITQSGSYYNANVSMTEIQSAYNAGKVVIAKWGSASFLYDGSTFAKNVAVQPNEVTSQYFTRGSGYRLNYYSKMFFKPPTYYFWLNRDSSRLYSSDVTPAQFIQKDPLNEAFTVVCNTIPSQGPSSGDEVYEQLRFDGIYHVYSTNPDTGDPFEAIRVQFSGYAVDTYDGTTSLMIAYVDLDVSAENTSWYAYNAVVDYYSLM